MNPRPTYDFQKLKTLESTVNELGREIDRIEHLHDKLRREYDTAKSNYQRELEYQDGHESTNGNCKCTHCFRRRAEWERSH